MATRWTSTWQPLFEVHLPLVVLGDQCFGLQETRLERNKMLHSGNLTWLAGKWTRIEDVFPIKKGIFHCYVEKLLGYFFRSLWASAQHSKKNGNGTRKKKRCAKCQGVISWCKEKLVVCYPTKKSLSRDVTGAKDNILSSMYVDSKNSCRSQWVRRMTGNDNDNWWQLYTNLPSCFDLWNHPLLMVQNSNTTARLWNENSSCFKTSTPLNLEFSTIVKHQTTPYLSSFIHLQNPKEHAKSLNSIFPTKCYLNPQKFWLKVSHSALAEWI